MSFFVGAMPATRHTALSLLGHHPKSTEKLCQESVKSGLTSPMELCCVV